MGIYYYKLRKEAIADIIEWRNQKVDDSEIISRIAQLYGFGSRFTKKILKGDF